MVSSRWANATDITQWADTRDAQANLPKLVRRLIASTTAELATLKFRAGEGVQYGGWDGIVETRATDPGTPFVPSGISVWEMGVSPGVRDKATEDYGKRTKHPLGVDPKETTFVFLTPRRWKPKDEWCRQRKEEGIWKDVQALDADDLETWLENAPAVHLWLSTELGKTVDGAEDLFNFSQDWFDATHPSLTDELIRAGRDTAADATATHLRGPAGLLELQGQTPQEAIAFLTAVVREIDDGSDFVGARTVVVRREDAWQHFALQARPLILVPTFADRNRCAAATQKGPSRGHPIGAERSRLARTHCARTT